MVSALNSTVSPTAGFAGDDTQSPVADAGAPIRTPRVFRDLRPRSLVTVRMTVNAPGVLNECVTTLPFFVTPSPKSQSKLTIDWLDVAVVKQLPLASTG